MEAQVVILTLAAAIVDLVTLAIKCKLAELVAVAAISVNCYRVVIVGCPFFTNVTATDLFCSFVCAAINYLLINKYWLILRNVDIPSVNISYSRHLLLSLLLLLCIFRCCHVSREQESIVGLVCDLYYQRRDLLLVEDLVNQVLAQMIDAGTVFEFELAAEGLLVWPFVFCWGILILRRKTGEVELIPQLCHAGVVCEPHSDGAWCDFPIRGRTSLLLRRVWCEGGHGRRRGFQLFLDRLCDAESQFVNGTLVRVEKAEEPVVEGVLCLGCISGPRVGLVSIWARLGLLCLMLLESEQVRIDTDE